MNRKTLFVILLVLGLVLTACADQEQPDSVVTELPPEPDSQVVEEPATEGQEEATPTESPAPAEAGAPLTADQLTGVLWQWQDLIEAEPAAQSVVPSPENYSVVFLDDGAMVIQADCNNVAGSYLLDAGQLRIILGPSTMAYCGDDSLDTQFLDLLVNTSSGTVEDGRLKLFTSDGATMGFNNAGPATKPETESNIDEIANILWQWQDLVETQPAGQSIVPNPENYTIGFRYDGSVNVQADCNRILGSYELQGNSMAITLGPSTMAFCGEESLDQQFLALLGAVSTFSLEGGRLELSTAEGATMGFSNGGELPGTVGIAPGDISIDTTGVAESWQAYVVPEKPYDDSMPPGPVGLPEHIEITFNGQTPDEREAFDPVMYIIPVTAYETMYELNENESITRIMNAIAEMTYSIPEPPPTSGMPVLPLEQVGTGFNDISASVDRIGANSQSTTKNGYRFVGRWNQDANPVTNQGLRYVYQGFTNDGVYLVSYWNPVRTDALPDNDPDFTQEQWDSFYSDPMAHINSQTENLNGLSASDWQPDLNNLDALVASLQIEGMVSSGVEEKTWAWTARGPVDAEPQPVVNPTQYTITYNADGTFNYQADCNVGGGGYSVVGGFNGSIQHALGPSTLAACPHESRADEFLGAVAAVQDYRLLPGGHQMQQLLPAGGDALTFTDAQFVEIDIPEPEPGVPTATVTAPEGVFIRTGPGTSYPSLGVAPYGETGTVIGVSEDGQWWVIDAPAMPGGQVWVSAAHVAVENVEDVPVVATPVLPTPVPTPTPVPPPSPSISFTADSTSINKGDCTTLRWNVENIQAIWVYPAGLNYQDYPETGQGSQQVCPEQTTTYEMRVLHVDGSSEIRSITIQVNQPNTLADTSWNVISLYANQVPVPGSSMALQFIGDSDVAANGGCNTFNGGYSVHFSGISIGPLAGTRMSCGEDLDAQETAYLQALESATTFSQSGEQLILYAPGTVEVARFAALRAVPLSGG